MSTAGLIWWGESLKWLRFGRGHAAMWANPRRGCESKPVAK